MEAVKFIKEEGRMCKYFRNEDGCISCRLSCARNGKNMGCTDFSHNYPEEAVRIVKEWAKENPVITNEDKFQEVFGKTSDDKDLYSQDWWDKEYINPKEK